MWAIFLVETGQASLGQADTCTDCGSKSHWLVLRSCNVQHLRHPGAGPSTASVCSVLSTDLPWTEHINLPLVGLWFLGIWQWWKANMFSGKILVDTFYCSGFLAQSLSVGELQFITHSVRSMSLGNCGIVWCPQWNCLMKWALLTTQEASYALITAHEVSISSRSLTRFFWGAKIINFHFLVALLIGVQIVHPFHSPWNNAPHLLLLWGSNSDVFWPITSKKYWEKRN